MEFSTNNIMVIVVEDNDKMETLGIPSWMPSAVCDRSDADNYNAVVSVTTAFFKLSKASQDAFLTHECGHAALGHLDLDICQGVDLVVNEELEAQADAWAVSVIGQDSFDAAIRECGELIIKTINADIQTEMMISQDIQKRINLRNEWIERNNGIQ